MADEKNRLDKIYTRSGDTGDTSLASGERLTKSDIKIQSLGDIDELNCQLGVLIAHLGTEHLLYQTLSCIQHQLFDLGGQLAMDDSTYQVIEALHIKALEDTLDELNQQIPPLKDFILPGGSIPAAHCHLTRAVCRRLERQFSQLVQACGQHRDALKYINRLSDLLFVCARILAREGKSEEILWRKEQKLPCAC